MIPHLKALLESNPVLLLFEKSLREVLFTKSTVIKAVTQTQFETCVTAFILLISGRGPFSKFSYKVSKRDLTLVTLTKFQNAWAKNVDF